MAADDEIFSFGEWVRRRRKVLDLTQAELAQRVRCATITIRKIEADALRPSRQIAERLASCLAIPLEKSGMFLQAARAELAVDRLGRATPLLDTPTMDVPRPSRGTGALRTDTVTFLFTDIAGSTRLWEQQPTAMQAALARHDAILRQVIAAHNGVVVKSTGDGFHAVFALATDALAATITAQRALQAEDWGATGLPHGEPL